MNKTREYEEEREKKSVRREMNAIEAPPPKPKKAVWGNLGGEAGDHRANHRAVSQVTGPGHVRC